MCELESFHESYSSGILPDKISTIQLLQTREVNERLCIGEVGVDLELCVHAHGHDVDPIMEASCNYFLDIISFWYRWIDFFAIVVPTMFSFKYHFSCKFKAL